MLKIKDNVDLKELEKFGLIYDSFGFYHSNHNEKGRIIIDAEDDRFITASGDSILTILFDLIQAGLVEKVEKKLWNT